MVAKCELTVNHCPQMWLMEPHLAVPDTPECAVTANGYSCWYHDTMNHRSGNETTLAPGNCRVLSLRVGPREGSWLELATSGNCAASLFKYLIVYVAIGLLVCFAQNLEKNDEYYDRLENMVRPRDL